MPNRPTRRLALALATASLVLAACGGGGSGSSTPTNNDPQGWNAVTTLKTTDTVVGTGSVVENGKSITVNYTGWLYDVRIADTKGTRFDSSVGGSPLVYTQGAGQLIPGFEQGAAGMKVGGKRTVTIPASLAYGTAGRAPSIPGGAALVFDLEIVAVR